MSHLRDARRVSDAVVLLVVAVAVVGVVAWIGAASVDDACHRTGPPVMRPVPGTPRAGYCDALDSFGLVPTLILVPTALAAAAAFALRSRPRIALGVSVAISVLVIANAIIAGSLEYSVTV